MRIAFTIILNGMHHLLHNDYYKSMLRNFDLWVVAEGASNSNGSTSWCKNMTEQYQNNGHSVDGTMEFLFDLQKKHSNFKVVTSDGKWKSKDHQVNAAISKIKETANSGFLWQVDIDEQWEKCSLEEAEKEMLEKGLKSAGFLCDYYVGPDILARGEWGEGLPNGSVRMWKWEGEHFITHEPPVLAGKGPHGVLSQKFKHYSYYFEKDVKFKNDWYSGHENVLDRWRTINSLPREAFPIHLSNLIVGPWGQSKTLLYKTELE